MGESFEDLSPLEKADALHNVAAVPAMPTALKVFLFVHRTSTLCIHSMYRDQPASMST
ncbi:hypothetical protein E4U41_003741, partial [Claviceps citrina]